MCAAKRGEMARCSKVSLYCSSRSSSRSQLAERRCHPERERGIWTGGRAAPPPRALADARGDRLEDPFPDLGEKYAVGAGPRAASAHRVAPPPRPLADARGDRLEDTFSHRGEVSRRGWHAAGRIP